MRASVKRKREARARLERRLSIGLLVYTAVLFLGITARVTYLAIGGYY